MQSTHYPTTAPAAFSSSYLKKVLLLALRGALSHEGFEEWRARLKVGGAMSTDCGLSAFARGGAVFVETRSPTAYSQVKISADEGPVLLSDVRDRLGLIWLRHSRHALKG